MDSRRAHQCSVALRASAAPSMSRDAAETIETDIRYGIGSTQGPRDTMEDVAYAVPNGPCGLFYCSVLDGHAGIASARYLEAHLFDTINRAFKEDAQVSACALDDLDEEGLCCPIGLTSIMTSSYKTADEQLLTWLKGQPEPEAGSGCTATSVLVDKDRIIVANVGDSRAVMSRASGAIDLSVEHRVYGEGDVVTRESKRVEACGGWVDDGRVCGILAVSRAFGDASFKGDGLKALLQNGVRDGFWTAEFAQSVTFTSDPVISVPDVLEMSVSPEDEFVIVATDGLWDVVSSKEGCEFVRKDLRKGLEPSKAAERLITIAERRRTQDNVAVVVIDLKGADFWKSAAESRGGKMFGLF
jgi:protein phosphatase 1A